MTFTNISTTLFLRYTEEERTVRRVDAEGCDRRGRSLGIDGIGEFFPIHEIGGGFEKIAEPRGWDPRFSAQAR
ncbi:hypothetical protein N9A78_01690 [Akkermansiaceae bacterium]|nr:hypothetical protein [Akkermansiaceae bacterium]